MCKMTSCLVFSSIPPWFVCPIVYFPHRFIYFPVSIGIGNQGRSNLSMMSHHFIFILFGSSFLVEIVRARGTLSQILQCNFICECVRPGRKSLIPSAVLNPNRVLSKWIHVECWLFQRLNVECEVDLSRMFITSFHFPALQDEFLPLYSQAEGSFLIRGFSER